jgi:hypothetical protein
MLFPLLPSLTRNLMLIPVFSQLHTKTHSDNNKVSQKETISDQQNADMPMSVFKLYLGFCPLLPEQQVHELYCQISYAILKFAVHGKQKYL